MQWGFDKSQSGRRTRLMLAPSVNRIPRFCVDDALSDPARSMRDNFPSVKHSCGFRDTTLVVVCFTNTWRTACDRDETLFAAVGSVVRLRFPLIFTWALYYRARFDTYTLKSSSTSSEVSTGAQYSPATCTTPFATKYERPTSDHLK